MGSQAERVMNHLLLPTQEWQTSNLNDSIQVKFSLKIVRAEVICDILRYAMFSSRHRFVSCQPFERYDRFSFVVFNEFES